MFENVMSTDLHLLCCTLFWNFKTAFKFLRVLDLYMGKEKNSYRSHRKKHFYTVDRICYFWHKLMTVWW